jgi:uncharacterized protein (DUF58 family)
VNTATRHRFGFETVRARLRSRAAAWARRRQGDDRLPLAVNARRVYILPTRAGFAFAALVFVMLLAGLNYANSVALMITFALAGFGMIAMHLCHRNLVGIALRDVATVDAFAGEHGLIKLTLDNAADTPRIGIEAATDDTERVTVDVRAAGSARADLAWPLERRGRVVTDRIKLSTAFPFGLFRAWTWVHLRVAVIAWPVPRGRREPPPEAATGGNAPSVHRAGDEEWAALREFRAGDSPRHVAWAAYARGRGLLVKVYQAPAAHHRVFDLARVPDADLEARLEQLSAWVEGAHARGERYGLKLGPQSLAPEGGAKHREHCLRELALYGDPGAE